MFLAIPRVQDFFESRVWRAWMNLAGGVTPRKLSVNAFLLVSSSFRM
jgi:hypothetical protein